MLENDYKVIVQCTEATPQNKSLANASKHWINFVITDYMKKMIASFYRKYGSALTRVLARIMSFGIIKFRHLFSDLS